MYEPIILSLKVALIAVTIDAVLGTLVARVMARRDFPGKNLIESCIILPMVLPPTVLGYGLLILLGKRGPLGRLLLQVFDWQIVFTWWAAIFAAAVVSFPLMYQSAKAAFSSVDVSLEQAARTLGCGEGRVFLRVTLPLAYPGLLAGLVLGIMARVFPQLNVFMLSFPLNIGVGFLVIGLTLHLTGMMLGREFHALSERLMYLFELARGGG